MKTEADKNAATISFVKEIIEDAELLSELLRSMLTKKQVEAIDRAMDKLLEMLAKKYPEYSNDVDWIEKLLRKSDFRKNKEALKTAIELLRVKLL